MTTTVGKRHAVYLAFGAVPEPEEAWLLYAGRSGRFWGRLGDHRRDADWFTIADTLRVLHVPDRPTAINVEAAVIHYFKPLWNRRNEIRADRRSGILWIINSGAIEDINRWFGESP